jgi:outer membrane protein TolC
MRTFSFIAAFFCTFTGFAQSLSISDTLLFSLEEVVDKWALESPSAKVKKLTFQSTLLQFENYKKSFLPSLAFNLNPINFNRSLRQLQNPNDASYSHVEDYSNSSSVGLSVRQKVGLTGGDLSLNSNLSYLNEFSFERSSFSSTPINISYSQQLVGSRKILLFERSLTTQKNEAAIRQYCVEMLGVQQQALGLFMNVLISQLQLQLAASNRTATDTLLQIAKFRHRTGSITEYEYNQMELQHVNNLYQYENSAKSQREAMQHFTLFLGITPATSVAVVTPQVESPPALEEELTMSLFYQNNSFLLEQEIQKLEAEQNLYLTKLSAGFNSSISLSYGFNKYAENLSEAYQRPNTQQAVVVGMQIPIFQWGTNKNKVRIAQNSYDAMLITIEAGRQQRDNEVREKVAAYNHNLTLWRISERAYRLSQENHRMAAEKFALGKISVVDLNAAQQEQYVSLQRYYSSISSVWIGYFELRMLTLYDFEKQQPLTDILTK